MPLKECKTCGKPIASNAIFCPNCGESSPQKNTSKAARTNRNRGALGCMFLILAVVLFVYVKNQIKTPDSPEKIQQLLKENEERLKNSEKIDQEKKEKDSAQQMFTKNALSVAATKAHLKGNVSAIIGKYSNIDYSITVEYSSDYNACDDIYSLTQEFVRYLVSAGFDPSVSGQYKHVHTWAVRVGVKTVSGKPGVIDLCDVHYNPYKDVITR